jgi:hypothetical protein
MDEEIVHEVFWTETAKITFSNIVTYVRSQWTEREVEKFVNRTDEMISKLGNIQRYAGHPSREEMFA